MMTVMRLWLVIATLGLCQGLAGSAKAQNTADMNQLLPSVVRVSLIGMDENGDLYLHSVGSGFVAASGMVVTNQHVISASTLEDLAIVVTPHEGFGKPIIGRLKASYATADLALIEAPDLSSPPARIAFPPRHTSQVHAVGYPALVCDLLSCSADERIAPTVPDFSSGPISRFADRTPRGGAAKTIFHRAPISGGNSGGPIVDDCGRVVGINTWASAAYIDSDGSIQAPASLSVATHSDELKSFLSRSGVSYIADDETCRSAQEASEDLQEEIAALKSSLLEREAKAKEEADRLAAQQAEAARKQTLYLVGGGIALLLAFGLIIFAIIHHYSHRSSQPQGQQLATPTQTGHILQSLVAIAIVGVIAVFWLWSRTQDDPAPDQALATENLAAAADPESQTVALKCRLDPANSYGTDSRTDNTSLSFDRASACANGRTRYVQTDRGFERMIVSDSSPHIIINRFDAALSKFVQDSFIVSSGDWAEANTETKTILRGCPTAPSEVETQNRQIETLHKRYTDHLPTNPAKRVTWSCTHG